MTQLLRDTGSLEPRSTARTDGRAAPGERVVASVPHAHYKTLSTIAALSAAKGIVASASHDGGTTAARFVDFVRDDLVPVLRKGSVVVMDNLAAHNDRRVDALVESAGCEVMRLPPYSPDFNPIENAISKVKAMLRKLAKRTVPALFDARDRRGVGVGDRVGRQGLHRP